MAQPPLHSGAPRRPRVRPLPHVWGVWRTWLVVVGLVLAGLNLRPAITSLGALLEDVRDTLGMSGSIAGLLTSAPPLCFAVFGAMVPRLARRFGPGAVMCASMAAITLGLTLRPLAGNTAVFIGASACALMGIAIGNVQIPVIIKRRFPGRVGPMTGLYSMALALGTAAAAATAVPLAGALGGNWRFGLGAWAALGAAAVLPWIPLVRRHEASLDAAVGGRSADDAADRPTEKSAQERPDDHAARAPGPDDAEGPTRGEPGTGPAPDRPAKLLITRSPTAWALAVFFGLQASGAYIAMGWIPQIFRDAGLPADTAGLLLAVTMVMGVPLGFVIPRVAASLSQQGAMVVTLGACGLAGYAGLYLAPESGALVWAVLLGISNCAFPLALTLVAMRADTGAGVAQLSAFAQSTGYLLSVPGPLLVGVLYQHSGGWGLPIALMAGIMVPQILTGFVAGRNRTVEAECTVAGERSAT